MIRSRRRRVSRRKKEGKKTQKKGRSGCLTLDNDGLRAEAEQLLQQRVARLGLRAGGAHLHHLVEDSVLAGNGGLWEGEGR